MLGGYSIVHVPDIRDSRRFLQTHMGACGRTLALGNPYAAGKLMAAVDVGAGVGRVSEHLLMPHFDKVAILESDARFVQKAAERIGSSLHRTFNCRLQDFVSPGPGYFDLIWIQWVLLYASDGTLAFLMAA